MNPVVLPFAVIEIRHLLELLDELVAVLEDAPDTPDAGTAAFTPDPYPDDEQASAAFREATGSAILERRVNDVGVVRAALTHAEGAVAHIGAGKEPLRSQDVVIAATDLDAWLRTLTALRLVLASRLGVGTAEHEHQDDPRSDVYDWLGYRLDQLVRAADACDGLDQPTWI